MDHPKNTKSCAPQTPPSGVSDEKPPENESKEDEKSCNVPKAAEHSGRSDILHQDASKSPGKVCSSKNNSYVETPGASKIFIFESSDSSTPGDPRNAINNPARDDPSPAVDKLGKDFSSISAESSSVVTHDPNKIFISESDSSTPAPGTPRNITLNLQKENPSTKTDDPGKDFKSTSAGNSYVVTHEASKIFGSTCYSSPLGTDLKNTTNNLQNVDPPTTADTLVFTRNAMAVFGDGNDSSASGAATAGTRGKPDAVGDINGGVPNAQEAFGNN
ncbi:hypothetical protein OWV82_005858 [Melia azedarach]|uniref:Uncharacterized protein n=1 Tax=Melia azedarach TaxID=155640 RepID=A0ACC1YFP1_MELAZ|nr:hypothetical protein OWV82_005858 [Melia azedarach]